MDPVIRRSWHCGYLERGEWSEPYEGPTHLAGEPFELEVCPGWLVRQDPVIEASQAAAAFDKGELATFFPDPPNGLVDAALAAAQSFNAYQSAKIKEQREKHSHGH